MKVSHINVTALEVRDIASLDPIRVFLQDFGEGQGRIVIECYGRAWGSYWPAMGAGGMRGFFGRCEAEYLAGVLYRGQKTSKQERDYLIRIIMAVKLALLEMPEAALPCPHCGGPAVLKRYQHDTTRVYYGCSVAECNFTFIDHAEALANWNRRASTTH